MSPEITARKSNPAERATQKPVTGVAFERASASPADLDRKSASLNSRGFVLMAARAEVSILTGEDEGMAKRRLCSDFESFKNLPLDDKRRMYAELRENLERSATRSAFLSALDTYSDIARDSSNGPMDDLVRLEAETREKEFDTSPLPSRLLLIARLRIDTHDMLIEKFPIYLSLWEGVSQSNGQTQEDITAEKAALQIKFDQASERGKAGISRDLRGKIETADLSRFQAYLEMYAKLFNEQGLVENDDHPLPETWQSMFEKVNLKRRVQLLHALESKTYLLLAQEHVKKKPEVSRKKTTDDKTSKEDILSDL